MDVVVEAHLMMSQQKNIERRTPKHRGGNASAATAGCHSHGIHSFDPCIEQDCDALRIHTSDTTRSIPALERNALVEANSFAAETDNFSSSPLMVQLIFFERSH
jgi:hypothetical protein